MQLEGNPLEDPPAEVLQRGSSAILSYFSAFFAARKTARETNEEGRGRDANGKQCLDLRSFALSEVPLRVFEESDEDWEEVYLDKNSLRLVPQPIALLKRVKVLTLTYNDIAEVCRLGGTVV